MMPPMTPSRILPLAAAAAISLAACGGGGDSAFTPDTVADPVDTDAPAASDPTDDPQPSEPPATDAPLTTDAPPATTAPVEADDAPSAAVDDRTPGDGSSPETAASLTAAPITFTQDEGEWSFEMNGLLDVGARNEDDGTCVLLFGTATATATGDRPWTSPAITPDIGLRIGGELVESGGSGSCEREERLASEHADGFSNPSVIPGSAFSFALTYRTGESASADVEEIVFGPEDDDELAAKYFLPTLIDSAPSAVVPTTDYSAFPAVPFEGAAVAVGAERGPGTADEYDLVFQGLVDIPMTELGASFGAGECRAVVGSATATGVSSGFVTFNGHGIGLLVGGRMIDEPSPACDTEELDAAGFQELRGSNIAVGTSIDFYHVYFVPDLLAASEQLIVTDAFFVRAPQYFVPTQLGAIPAPAAPADASIIPAPSGLMTDGPFSFQARAETTTYTITLDGVVDVGPNDDGTATCFAILGTMTADQEERSQAPIGLVTGGEYHPHEAFDCGERAIEDAGWMSFLDIDFVPGEAVPFNRIIAVPERDLGSGSPQVMVIGDPSSSQPIFVLEPVYLDAVPLV